MLVLTRDDVRRLIEIESASQAIDQATALPSGAGLMLPMAASISWPSVIGVKVLADAPENAARACAPSIRRSSCSSP